MIKSKKAGSRAMTSKKTKSTILHEAQVHLWAAIDTLDQSRNLRLEFGGAVEDLIEGLAVRLGEIAKAGGK